MKALQGRRTSGATASSPEVAVGVEVLQPERVVFGIHA